MIEYFSLPKISASIDLISKQSKITGFAVIFKCHYLAHLPSTVAVYDKIITKVKAASTVDIYPISDVFLVGG
jgi:hypothetical protein